MLIISSPASSTSRLSVPSNSTSRLSIPSASYLSPSPRNSAAQKEYIERLDVVQGSSEADAPNDCIREISGQSSTVDLHPSAKYAASYIT